MSERRRLRVRAVRLQDLAKCQWCGRAAERELMRDITMLGRKFHVCNLCPPSSGNTAVVGLRN